jgi:hypothetical protein
MANPARGEATISIGGRDRTLSFDQNDIADIEESLDGRSVIGYLRRGEADSIAFQRIAIAIGLRRAGKLVTPRQVGRWMSEEPGKHSARTAALIKALLLALKGPDALKADAELDDEDEDRDDESDEETGADERPPQTEAGTGQPASKSQPE